MKVFVQDPETKRFYKCGGRWTEKKEEAERFENLEEASRICQAERLRASIILEFSGSGHQLEIPC